MDEFNKKAARTLQEYELFGRLDTQLEWPGPLQLGVGPYPYLTYSQPEVDHVSRGGRAGEGRGEGGGRGRLGAQGWEA
jgi:hypothetical protein